MSAIYGKQDIYNLLEAKNIAFEEMEHKAQFRVRRPAGKVSWRGTGLCVAFWRAQLICILEVLAQ